MTPKVEPPKDSLEELIEKRVQIAANETKSDDKVVQIAWLADGIRVWYQTNGDRGNSPEDARRYIISSVTRLIKLQQEALLSKVEAELPKDIVNLSHQSKLFEWKNNGHNAAMLQVKTLVNKLRLEL